MDVGEKNAQDWNKCRQFDREASWTLGVAVESARLVQGSKFQPSISQSVSVQDGRDRTLGQKDCSNQSRQF